MIPPRRDQGRVRDFFRNYDHLLGVIGELKCLQSEPPPHFPAVPLILLSRFKDNLYIVCLHIPAHLKSLVREALSVLLHLVYGVKLKWELHHAVATWGEGSLRLSAQGSLVLLRKPCTLCLNGDPLNEKWCKWVDRWSPHCRLVWRSQFPGLLIKCLWYALDTHSFRLNVRSVLWGIGCKGYPRKWWLGTLHRFWNKYALHDVICMAQLIAWVRQGASRATR